MKQLILFFVLFAPIFVMGQYDDDIETKPVTATYDDVVSKKVKGSITTYISKTGDSFSVGDTIVLGKPYNGNEFVHLNQNATIQSYPMTIDASGSIIRIKSIKSVMKKAQVMATAANGNRFQTFIINFDLALESGEVLPNRITSDQALSELKRCKDKLDLGLMTQEEFDKKKAELAKYIK